MVKRGGGTPTEKKKKRNIQRSVTYSWRKVAYKRLNRKGENKNHKRSDF